MTTLVLLGVAYVLGVLTVVAVEVVGLVILIRRLNRKIAQVEHEVNERHQSSSPNLGASFYNKQGVIWILEPEKIKPVPVDSEPREPKWKKEILEVSPVQKYAKIKEHSLFILESDGSHTEIRLGDCMVEAVSATSVPSKKWAKRYPIRVESKGSKLYKGSKMLYIYLDTSSEKEEWCKALRLACCSDKEKLEWLAKLNLEFHKYVVSLNAEYPYFMKPSMGFSNDPKDKSVKFDESNSKVRQFLKKLAKKASKNGIENKTSWTSVTAQDEKKVNLKTHPFQDFRSVSMGALGQPFLDATVPKSSSAVADLGNENRSSINSDVTPDEGTLACNILLSRLFFDAKSNVQLKNFIQERIQRTLANLRSPSFIGAITCTSVDPGNLPPYIHTIRVLPSNMDELWAFEIDMEYSGGAILNVETRLEVQELDSEEGKGLTSGTNALDKVPSDLLEDFEVLGEQLNFSEKRDEIVEKDGESKADGIGNHKSTARASSQVSRWKTVLQTVVKQVSQVPLSLGIRVSSLRGTMRFYIKPPPSDQIWFGFTSMPDIHFELEPFVGDHKITNSRLALFLINRFKVAVRETLVLPNSESVYVPWMLAEKNDWVTQKAAPFLWVKHEISSNSTTKNGSNSQSAKENPMDEVVGGPSISYVDEMHHDSNDTGNVVQPENDSSSKCAASLILSTRADSDAGDLTAPLLKVDELDETVHLNSPEKSETDTIQSAIWQDQQKYVMDNDDSKLKRIGTRARMLGFGKKVGEKFEEKRRHIEEKGRHIVERMKAPQKLDKTDSE